MSIGTEFFKFTGELNAVRRSEFVGGSLRDYGVSGKCVAEQQPVTSRLMPKLSVNEFSLILAKNTRSE